MKLFEKIILMVAVAPWIFSGCSIGKTSTLFVTKSNVGFDASAKPPTFELDISRVEGVVAPQFENGKKLPVMASFKFQNKGAFQPNVGSAFATGDAATTMAALYGDDTPPGNWESRATMVKDDALPSDSTLNLDDKPEVKRWLPFWLHKTFVDKMFPKPKFLQNDVRPVFFGTDTAMGLKVAWSGMAGGFPDSAQFGYNRKELAFVPITMKDTGAAQGQKHPVAMKMSSLMATIDSGVKGLTNENGSPTLDYGHIQYFATGNAATLLALQRDVRAAMLARLDPNKEIYKSLFLSGKDPTQLSILTRALVGVYDAMDKLGNLPEKDLLAASHVQRLDDAASKLSIPPSFQANELIQYKYTPATSNLTIKTTLGNYTTGKPFFDAIRYWTDLGASINALRLAKAAGTNVTLNGQPASEQEQQTWSKQLERQQAAFDDLDQKLRTNQAVIEAMHYYSGLLNPK